eukprot:c31084_g1_i1 orf=642-920(-)
MPLGTPDIHICLSNEIRKSLPEQTRPSMLASYNNTDKHLINLHAILSMHSSSNTRFFPLHFRVFRMSVIHNQAAQHLRYKHLWSRLLESILR